MRKLMRRLTAVMVCAFGQVVLLTTVLLPTVAQSQGFDRLTPNDEFLRYWTDFSMTRDDFVEAFTDAELPPDAQTGKENEFVYVLTRRTLPQPDAGAVTVTFREDKAAEVQVEFIADDVTERGGTSGFLQWLNESIGNSGVIVGEGRPAYLWWGLESKRGVRATITDAFAILLIAPEADVKREFLRDIREEIKRRFPENVDLVIAECEAGMLSEAVADAKGIKEWSSKARVYARIADAQAVAGNRSAALQAYFKAISDAESIEDEYSKVCAILELCDIQNRIRPDSVDLFTRVEELMTKTKEPQHIISEIGRQCGDWASDRSKHDVALQAIELVLKTPEERIYDQTEFALEEILKHGLKDTDAVAAERTTRRVIDCAKRVPYPSVCRSLAKTLMARGMFAQAAKAFEGAAITEGYNGVADPGYTACAQACNRQFDEAAASLERVTDERIPLEVVRAFPLAVYSVALADAGQFDRAFEAAENNVLGRIVLPVYSLIGQAQLRQGDRAGAAKTLALAVAKAEFEAIDLLADMGMLDMACEEAEVIPSKFNEDADRIGAIRKVDATTVASWKKIANLVEVTYLSQIAAAYARRGDQEKAKQTKDIAIQRAEQLEPELKVEALKRIKDAWIESQWLYFDHLIESGQVDEAIEHSKGLDTRDKQSPGFEQHQVIVRAYAKSGRYNAALRVVQESIEDPAEKARGLLAVFEEVARL